LILHPDQVGVPAQSKGIELEAWGVESSMKPFLGTLGHPTGAGIIDSDWHFGFRFNFDVIVRFWTLCLLSGLKIVHPNLFFSFFF
jgi:hypothetical protein